MVKLGGQSSRDQCFLVAGATKMGLADDIWVTPSSLEERPASRQNWRPNGT